jgi:uncharacterized protein (TIGR00297 family)
MLIRFLLGLGLSALIAGVAYCRKSLTRSGALAATAVGTAIFFGGGPWWFLALFTFFVTSTLLGRVGRARKAALAQDYQKGDRRDAMQVFANGGVAALCALMVMLAPSPWLGGAVLGALATATGDTWATELGVLSRRPPVSLLGLRRVPAGTSGAVSLLGLVATLLGGLAIGGVGSLAPVALGTPAWVSLVVGAVAGVGGSLVDSLAGATIQASFHCPTCDRACEVPVHHCGTTTEHQRGPLWLDNDTVNLLATFTGALLGGTLEFLLEPALHSA